MKERDPHQVALAALTEFAGEGRFGWGMPLVATTLAEELGLSPTPVREALARLAGEGVIEHRPGRGYFAPCPSSSDIVEFYELHRRLVHWAIDDLPATKISLDLLAEAPASNRLDLCCLGLVEATRNELLTRTYRRIRSQLRPIRAVEAVIAPLAADVAEDVEKSVLAGEKDGVRAQIDRYHDDRKSIAHEVFITMRRSLER